MKTATKRRPVGPVSAEHGDVSQVWAPLPGVRQADHEHISRDCAKRAAWYSRSAFWSDGVVGRKRLPATKPVTLKQRELFYG